MTSDTTQFIPGDMVLFDEARWECGTRYIVGIVIGNVEYAEYIVMWSDSSKYTDVFDVMCGHELIHVSEIKGA